MSDKKFLILAINPGSTSTKVAVFEGEELRAEATTRYTPEDLAGCPTILDQMDLRMRYMMAFLSAQGIAPESLDAIVGRGGVTKPISSGTFSVNEQLVQDLSTSDAARHASSLGGLMAHEMETRYGMPAYVVDPVVVDELQPVARYSGIPQISRRSIFHALNQKAIARRYAKEHDTSYDKLRLIVAHLGGGISIGAHCYGKVIDVNDALGGEGCFSPERCGSLPLAPLIGMCYSGEYTQDEMMQFLNRKGGVMAYLGNNDMFALDKAARQHPDSEEGRLLYAMSYQISKEIAALAAVLACDIDAILLTGGLANVQPVTDDITRRVGKLAPVVLYPGEDEMLALVQGAIRVLSGAEEPAEYK